MPLLLLNILTHENRHAREDFHRVIEVRSKTGSNPMGMRSEDIVYFIKPEKMLPIPALDNNDLVDFERLSEKLGKIIEAIFNRFKKV